jgi:phenylalanyl-tRNA synthetase beta chain
MKLSIAWIFDHIDSNWKKLDIPELVTQLNRTTAEIESFQKIFFDADRFALAEVIAVGSDVAVRCDEWKQDFTLPRRDDAHVGALFIISRTAKAAGWTTLQEWHCSKDGLLPAMLVDEKNHAGGWKKEMPLDDYTFDIDNKSITHRPDLWGHRGFAREIAAMLGLELKSLENFLSDLPVEQHRWSAQASKNEPISIKIDDQEGCHRFAGAYVKDVVPAPSVPWMAYRLATAETRPIDGIVDATNYAMLDCGHPMHAFDADTIAGKEIIVRRARKKESLELLDGHKLELRPDDIVIADKNGAISLAGIMGGKTTSVTSRTRDLFLEAAWFDATTIRHTAAHHKVRTEASARFEKTLDPNGNIIPLQRFVRLLQDVKIPFKECSAIQSVGPEAESIEIVLTHSFIERRLGCEVTTKKIESICHALAFELKHKKQDHDVIYTVTVPSMRSTKDVQIKEDIVEEIARFVGYDNIKPRLPELALTPSNLSHVERGRLIHEVCAYSMGMQEIYGYAFFDESFLHKLHWQPENTISVQSPVSENWRRLVTTLLPNMFNAVEENSAESDHLRFFEWARVWHKKPSISEQRRLAGIFFDKKNPVDFYDAKLLLSNLFETLRCTVSWQQVADPEQPWFAPYRTAHILHNGQIIGTAGIVEPFFLKDITDGHAFAFELDGDFLLSFQHADVRFVPLPKYPDVHRDISMMVPLKVTVAQLQESIADADDHIKQVVLQDFFTKEEWKDKKSLTFRLVLRDTEKTMTKEEADAVCAKVAQVLHRAGAEIR